MVDTVVLRTIMDESGYKYRFIAQKIGLSYQGMLNKLNNKHDFTLGEVKKLCELLNISDSERNDIFFCL